MAEGIRLKAAENWQRIAKGDGKALVENSLECFVSYYEQKFSSTSFMVRQSCCHATAEFIRKVCVILAKHR